MSMVVSHQQERRVPLATAARGYRSGDPRQETSPVTLTNATAFPPARAVTSE